MPSVGRRHAGHHDPAARVVLVLELLDRALPAGARPSPAPGASRSRAGRARARGRPASRFLPLVDLDRSCRRSSWCGSARRRRLRRLTLQYGQRFCRDVPLEVVAEVLERALQRLDRSRRQRAEGVAGAEQLAVLGAGARGRSALAAALLDARPGSSRPRAARRGTACTSRRTPARRTARGCAPCRPGRSGRRARSSCRCPGGCRPSATESKSIGTSRCSAIRKSVEAPPGSKPRKRQPVAHAAGVLFEDLAHRRAHRQLPQPGLLHLAAHAVELGAAVLACARAP